MAPLLGQSVDRPARCSSGKTRFELALERVDPVLDELLNLEFARVSISDSNCADGGLQCELALSLFAVIGRWP